VATLGAVMALPFPPNDQVDRTAEEQRRAITFSGFYAALWMVDMDLAEVCHPYIATVNAERRLKPNLFAGPPAQVISAPGADIAILTRGASQAPEFVLAINPDPQRPATMPAHTVLPEINRTGALSNASERIEAGDMIRLSPGEAKVFRFLPAPFIRRGSRKTPPPDRLRAVGDRIAIESVSPTVDGGHFPARCIAGGMFRVEANIVGDGHGRLQADLLWRAADKEAWDRVPMEALVNDQYVASFPLTRVGRHLFTIEAWHDPFATLLEDIAKKRGAELAVTVEIEEAVKLIRTTGNAKFTTLIQALDTATPEDQLERLAKPEIAAAMRYARQDHLVRLDPARPVEAERMAAGFASWYELFPRSQSGDPARHGTFRDVIARLPAIRAMGFDTLYFPPIHPIGRIHRKGRNNTLTSGPADPGSPYAIGSDEGGHDAIHPALGNFEEFQLLCSAAAKEGMEIALDFAIQCAPDHPWVREHPEWFEWRPDGTIRYAENPPKRYEDIVNVAFYAPKAVPSLWNALRDVVLFWVKQGVRIFRVDNPHTKPLPFWEWLIDDIHTRTPDVIFLAEAFTRPTMMYRLAKIGFSQSYTYFTWRNTKQELISYFTEVSQAPVADFFRPHLFVNTPDINPFFLQQGGRPAFLIRAALATTLSGLWGMYSGFELCEARALPGREEYLDSEKYQIRSWDWDQPGNIIAEITRLNEIRKANPALHSHRGLQFLNCSSDAIIYYSKTSPDGRNTVLVAVNLDPSHAFDAEIEIPLWRFGLPDDASIGVEDLVHSQPFVWHGKRQRIWLDPTGLPFAIWRLDPAARISS